MNAFANMTAQELIAAWSAVNSSRILGNRKPLAAWMKQAKPLAGFESRQKPVSGLVFFILLKRVEAEAAAAK